ncbi:hypothetical protein BKA70DRAFT_704262 [Coprinopsis sp. MPI-PUGE-AT-0042]|nr:hypothetical protein BKA70DRAFT_704262 [Coprinopsis sp. MPI-PUGE-AT-0042]
MESGPPLTKAEKMPSPEPKYIEEWLHRLEDRSNPSRRQIIKFLCQAVSDIETDEEAPAPRIEQTLLQLCLSNPILLCGMARTSFLDRQTPLQWALASISSRIINPPAGGLKMPSLLSVLLKCSIKDTTDAQFRTVFDTIFKSCCKRSSNALFQCFNPEAKAGPDEPTFYYSITQVNETRFGFVINDFRVRMLTLGSINLMALYQGRIVSICLSVEADGAWVLHWQIGIDEAEGAIGEYKDLHLIDLIIYSKCSGYVNGHI